MTPRKILTENPHDCMPPCLIYAVEQILHRYSFAGVRNEDILRVVRDLDALLPNELAISDKEACELVKQAVGWRASYRAERECGRHGCLYMTPQRRVARTNYCLPKQLFPRRRYVFGEREDPFGVPSRWLNVSSVGSNRINDLVAKWWDRMWQLAFGDSAKVALNVECYYPSAPYITYAYGGYEANDLSKPMAAELVRSLSVDKGFLYRIRVTGLQVSDGFLPADVIMSAQEENPRVVAFRRRGDRIFLEVLPTRLT